jgi:hypothetical protein
MTADYAYDIDLRDLLHAPGMAWPQRRDSVLARILGSLWLADVQAAVGASWPYEADPEYPDEIELCGTAGILERMAASATEREFFGWWQTLADGPASYDRVSFTGRELLTA